MSETGKALAPMLQMFQRYAADAEYRKIADYGGVATAQDAAPPLLQMKQFMAMGDHAPRSLPDIDEMARQFANSKAEHAATSHGKSSWQLMNELMRQKNIDKETFLAHTLLDEGIYYKIRGHGPGNPSMRTIVAFACGLGLDMTTTDRLMQSAGLAFDGSDEHMALRFCVSSGSRYPMELKNEFLTHLNFEPLGARQRI